jgi:hypothetical protein
MVKVAGGGKGCGVGMGAVVFVGYGMGDDCCEFRFILREFAVDRFFEVGAEGTGGDTDISIGEGIWRRSVGWMGEDAVVGGNGAGAGEDDDEEWDFVDEEECDEEELWGCFGGEVNRGLLCW